MENENKASWYFNSHLSVGMSTVFLYRWDFTPKKPSNSISHQGSIRVDVFWKFTQLKLFLSSSEDYLEIHFLIDVAFLNLLAEG